MKKDNVELVGGIGEKKSNGGTQFYLQDRVYDSECVATSIPTDFHPYYQTRERESKMSQLRIRKLTPKECLLLMGFDNETEKSMRQAQMSDSAIYHMAGDSIVVTCLMGLFGMLLPISENELQQKIENYVESLKNGTE